MIKNSSIISYGVDLNVMYPIDKNKAKEKTNLRLDRNYCLFSSSRYRIEKNFKLAENAIKLCNNTELIELTGTNTREEVNLHINSSDCVLLTSIREGSPQIIKEAMACNVPIVSTDVGDVKKLISDVDGCFISSFDPKDVAKNIYKVVTFNKKTEGRKKIKNYDNQMIADKVYNIYEMCLS